MPDPMLRFTQRARLVLSHSQVEAEKRRAGAIDTDHMLLALLSEEGCVAALALKRSGITPEQVAALLPGEADASNHPLRSLDLAPDVKTALSAAVEQARRLGHTYIGSEHPLLALSRIDGSKAVNILATLGLSASTIEAEIKRILLEHPPGSMQAVRRAKKPPSLEKEKQQTNLVYERLSRRSAWPSPNLTILIAFAGFFLSSVFVYSVWPQLMLTARVWNVWAGLIVHILSASAALLGPPAAGIISAMLTARDVQEGAQQMLALTGLSPRAIVRGYIRLILFRLRLLFTLMLAISPLYVRGGEVLLSLLYSRLFVVYYTDYDRLLTLGGAVLACTWLGTALGTALALRFGSGVTAGIVAALLVMSVIACLVGLLVGAALIAWVPLRELIKLVVPLLPALLGLLVVRQAERWTPHGR